MPLLRAIDKGLANSRIGIVLVTPALLQRLPKEGIVDKELSALLAGGVSFPLCMRRRMKLSGKSALCSPREPASTLRKSQWLTSRPSSPIW